MINGTSTSCIVTIKCRSCNWLISCGKINCTTISLSKVISEVHFLKARIRSWGVDCSTRTSIVFRERWISNWHINRFSGVDCSTISISNIISEIHILNSGIIRWRIINSTTSRISRILSKVTILNTSIIRWRIINSSTRTISYIIRERWINNRLIMSIISIVDCSTRSLSRILSKVHILNTTISRCVITDCSTRTISYITWERWINNRLIITFIKVYCTTILSCIIISEIHILNTAIFTWWITYCSTTSISTSWICFVSSKWCITNGEILSRWEKDCSTWSISPILSEIAFFNSYIRTKAINSSTTNSVCWNTSSTILISTIFRE